MFRSSRITQSLDSMRYIGAVAVGEHRPHHAQQQLARWLGARKPLHAVIYRPECAPPIASDAVEHELETAQARDMLAQLLVAVLEILLEGAVVRPLELWEQLDGNDHVVLVAEPVQPVAALYIGDAALDLVARKRATLDSTRERGRVVSSRLELHEVHPRHSALAPIVNLDLVGPIAVRVLPREHKPHKLRAEQRSDFPPGHTLAGWP